MTKKYKLPAGRALVLRSCAADMTSTNGFKWPDVGGLAEAPDWQDTKECGNGLHGWLYGQGDHGVSNYLDDDSKWLVVEVEESSIVMLGGKCKFPKGYVRFAGARADAAAFIRSHESRAAAVAVIGAVVQVGDEESAFVGAYGTATAGDRGTATAGYRGTATAGYGGTATAGYGGTATAGDGGTATAGYYGTATAGDGGTATAGDYGTATAGYGGTATAGDGGTATAGDYGTATAGDYGTATAGDGGEIRIRYWDGAADRYRTKVGYIGEDGLEANTAYRLDDARQFVKA